MHGSTGLGLEVGERLEGPISIGRVREVVGQRALLVPEQDLVRVSNSDGTPLSGS